VGTEIKAFSPDSRGVTPSVSSPLVSPVSPQVASSSTSSAMANFELDPHRFLPRGHGIIDGGPLLLPRTFVTPSHFVPDQFESHCVAVVEPEPSAQDLHDSASSRQGLHQWSRFRGD
jgi:hypothetical protein